MLKATDVMSEAVTIRGSATVEEAVKLMREKGVHALIVALRHDQDAYGIVTETDVIYKVTAYGKDSRRLRVCDIMVKPCIVVNPDLGVEYVARLFANTGIHQAPVIQGALLGMISIRDILTKGDFIEKPKETVLEERIRLAIAQARTVCTEKGPTSPECAVCWDEVEELQAEASHQRAEKSHAERTAFELFCEENPDALEARIYDN
ncbi:MAG: CBS domain-containing protein [Pegethrix bostrychoides GSE-TBD4-15B]|jgi:CBS domain-containing protein|uniref:CBS domain-containing protein n=1 Tax=Pegethrix bostrychoides GSE-TBD4-15B TaxID=2839662 RepID=A0A951P7M7_9CYAN|nr:CBS domain-containing protein [Pegethrix bostrychoides GSE-TBD4-15B]